MVIVFSSDIAVNANNLRRRQRASDKDFRIGMIRHDVDSLVIQLSHNRLHADAFDTDTSADRIDALIR